MKRTLGVLAFSVILLIPVLAQGQEYDVRSVRWGMSIEEVKASESSKPTEEKRASVDGAEIYQLSYGKLAKINDIYFDAIYIFQNQRLTNMVYIFSLPADKKNAGVMISSYATIFDSLCAKYGRNGEQGWEDTMSWYPWAKEDELVEPSEAFYRAFVQFNAYWSTTRTMIFESLSNDESSCLMGLEISYIGKNNVSQADLAQL